MEPDMAELLDLIRPGEILKEEFMEPLDLSANRVARDIDVPTNRITGIVSGDRAITADTALRLGLYFGIEPEFWMNLQMHYDLRAARRAAEADLKTRIRPLNAGG
jgi:addiction module HigA family antidote